MKRGSLSIIALTGAALLAGALLFCSFGVPAAHAQGDDDVADYWSSEESEDSEEGFGYNVFLKTGNPYIKIGLFFGLTLLSYLIFWGIFARIIKKGKSPANTFFQCFLFFMLSMLFIAFLCFSEYAMVQKYDEAVSYFSQLNWIYIAIIVVAWSVVSVVTANVLKGKV